MFWIGLIAILILGLVIFGASVEISKAGQQEGAGQCTPSRITHTAHMGRKFRWQGLERSLREDEKPESLGSELPSDIPSEQGIRER
jgi:hypothetical protein